MKKIITYLIIFSFIFSGFLILIPENAKASVSYIVLDIAGNSYGTYKTSFDDIATGVTDITSGYVYIEDKSLGDGVFRTNDVYDLTPPNCLQSYDNTYPYEGNGYINLTTSFEYIKLINFSFKCSSTNDFYVSFYDEFNNKHIYLRISTLFSKIYWNDITYGWREIYSSLIDYQRYYIRIQHNYTNQFWITFLNVTYDIIGSLETAGYYAGNYETFNYIYIDQNNEAGGLYFDNLLITYSEELPTEPPELAIFCTGNIPESHAITHERFVETQYVDWAGSGVSGTLTKVQFNIAENQYYYVSNNVTDYDICINGINYGNPDFIDYTNISVYSEVPYILTWNLSINLLDNNPVFSFGCYAKYGVTYWLGYGIDEQESIYGHYTHNNSVWHNDTGFNGYYYDFDLFYCFWIENIQEIPEQNDTNETTDTYKDIYFKFYDASRTENNLLCFKGISVDSSVMGTKDYVECLIYSIKSTNGFRLSYSTLDYFTVNINFTDGEYVNFNFIQEGYTNFNCRINNKFYTFKAVQKTIQLYAGQTYNIYLYPVGYIDGVNYINCGDSHPNRVESNKAYLCINKVLYDFGETIRCVYKLPDVTWLQNNGFSTKIGNYALKVYNRDDYNFALGRRSFLHESPRVYVFNIPAQHFDNNRHTHEIPIQVYNEYGFDDEYNDYELVIDTLSWEYFRANDIITDLIFYVSGIDFEPLGNITDITPNPCYSGQIVDISFTSNNIGWLEIKEPDGNSILYTQDFGYSEGTHVIPWRCSWEGFGNLPVYLYTKGVEYNHIDTEMLYVNASDDNETYGWRGYGVPYLYIPERQGNYIAGNSTVYIHYRTYKNDSIILIRSPRREQTYYSTTVSNESRNYLAIKLDSWMQLGTWNVTFYCGDIYGNNVTLYTEFNVVNEEGNWIEFTKHTYTTNEQFYLYIKNTYRVSITFYKNDVAIGESMIFDAYEPDYKIPVPNIKTEIGNWRVEMWRINDRNIVYELAEWECIVIKGTAQDIIGQELGFEIPEYMKLIIGVLIVLLMTISPILMIVLINKKSHRTINLPALVYVGFFFFGLIISILLGFLPDITIFIILFGLILGFLVMYLTGNLNKLTSS